MKINRMAEEKLAPEWVFENKQASDYIDKETLSKDEVDKILNMSCNVSEEEIVAEREKIEKCASLMTHYYCNAQWPDSIKSDLKEYAVVCGMDSSRFRTIDPASLISKITVVASDSESMIKTASVVTESPKLVIDAFKIDEKSAASHEKSKWQPEVKNAAKLSDRPSMSGIVPIRGGEDYFANSETQTARGRNSILNPDAIDKLAKSEKEDTGAKLKRENKEKEASKKTNHDKWEKEKIEAMSGREILPNRRVFPTEVMNVQSGIKGEVFDFDSIPDKTVGEQLQQAINERKEKNKHSFVVAKSSSLSVSEDFGEELKKHLGQID